MLKFCLSERVATFWEIMDGSGLERRADSANLVPHVSSRVTNVGSDHQSV
jgi:hypothetical protein